MGFRTYVATKYEIEYGNVIGKNYGQEEIEEAIYNLAAIAEEEIEIYVSEDYYQFEIGNESFLEAYNKVSKDDFIKKYDENKWNIIEQIKHEFDQKYNYVENGSGYLRLISF